MRVKNDKLAILIITLILFGITLIGVLLFYLSPEGSLGASNKGKSISKIVDFTTCQNDNNKDSCIDEKYIDNKKINIRYDKMKLNVVGEESTGAALYVNNKEIVSPKSLIYRIDNIIYVTKSTVLFATYEANIKNIKLYIYDFHGNKIMEIYELDKDQNIIIIGYKFEDNKVILTGNKHILIKSVVLHQEGDNKYIIENTDLCQEYKANQNITGNEIYKAEYELEYITNNKVSNLKKISGSEITINEHLKNIGCKI